MLFNLFKCFRHACSACTAPMAIVSRFINFCTSIHMAGQGTRENAVVRAVLRAMPPQSRYVYVREIEHRHDGTLFSE